jgi:hypothetical protein
LYQIIELVRKGECDMEKGTKSRVEGQNVAQRKIMKLKVKPRITIRKPSEMCKYDPTARPKAVPWPLHLSVGFLDEGSWFAQSEDGDTWEAHCPHCDGISIILGGRACCCPWCGGALAESDSRYIRDGETTACTSCGFKVTQGAYCSCCGKKLNPTAEEFEEAGKRLRLAE